MNSRANFILLTTLIIIIAALPILFGGIVGFKPSSPEFINQYVGVLISSLSIIIVAITLRLQYEEIALQRKQLDELNNSNQKNFQIASNSYDSQLLDLIENLFLSREMESIRNKCFELKQEIKTDRSILASIELIFEMQIKDDWGDLVNFKKTLKSEAYDYYLSFERLARHFDTISNYEMNHNTSRAIHFYYTWWRGLILDMKQCFKQAESKIPVDKRHLTFAPNWVDMSDRMDSKLSQFNLPLA